MLNRVDKKANRKARHLRVRKKVTGTFERPRLTVYKSNSNIYCQLVDDVKGVTILSASTLDKDLKSESLNIEACKKVGEAIGKKAIEKGITEAVFDRSGYKYHGRVKALCEAAREAGLKL
ncbi:50S ribosomal protein L18 [Citroniella saccharovorans]|uniref:Large ribosomal subunit protein uL18 n=1 Tax=Citroniella saccharovorans TaxID=2053367 RepID=A0AAW9MZL4_9FIRM|nr:50S ribosomal protein L18 [Citroniella saccharovorans]MEB3430082.1 50S ribosomal protein L18 [Citroniella saccharovorans]